MLFRVSITLSKTFFTIDKGMACFVIKEQCISTKATSSLKTLGLFSIDHINIAFPQHLLLLLSDLSTFTSS